MSKLRSEYYLAKYSVLPLNQASDSTSIYFLTLKSPQKVYYAKHSLYEAFEGLCSVTDIIAHFHFVSLIIEGFCFAQYAEFEHCKTGIS